ncbi:MFS transporter [Lichenicola cladoniae]|uniref:MFS transporter n=2 Tax=Lichenicola cladoniae TaxID=1484109 RepID=A0A6M8HW74_9PROT|nr:MFS transporter [Acetobacteraceae bacterium]QKE92540.1 MFS transporter [Lichenicola cladoniae]
MEGTTAVPIAAAAFVGTHFLLSHPLRRPIVRRLGETGFLGIYSLVAIATLGWLVVAYRAAPATAPLWPVNDVLWAAATIVMLVASVLLMGSLVRNPATPNPTGTGTAPDTASGVYAITRHPMLWSFALWGLCHIAVYPVAANIAVAGAIIVLSLVGAALQDRKKEQLLPEMWPAWESRTSYWPFAAIAQGRARLGAFGMHELLGGLVVWLAATWAHLPLAGWAAGIWRWV